MEHTQRITRRAHAPDMHPRPMTCVIHVLRRQTCLAKSKGNK